ncbi:hypothetical protein BDR06DRAFT_1009021 [Suillus hirtellus]|nr:hypothetical protein BDR06DRAFT_1009021 [Suillus hirtellus]
MQPRIQRRHELEGHDRAATVKLLSYVQHLAIAKATASSTRGLMAANVVSGSANLTRLRTKHQLHTFARKGDDSMEFNDKDAVDLMTPIIQGLEDQNTIDEQILPHTPIVPMATHALPTPLESRRSHSRTIVRDYTTIHDVESPNLGVDDLRHRGPRPGVLTHLHYRNEDLVGDGGESNGSADGAVAGAPAAADAVVAVTSCEETSCQCIDIKPALTSSGMEDLIPVWRWMPTAAGSKSLLLHDHIGRSVAGASKTSKSRTETLGQSALEPTIWSAKCPSMDTSPLLLLRYSLNITSQRILQVRQRRGLASTGPPMAMAMISRPPS